jgi:hypothetical protein
MGRKIPFDTMQSMGELLPRCIVTVEGKDFESKPTSTGKLMYRTRGEVIEPAELAGQAAFDQFVIGSDADPEAEQAATWNGFGGKRFRSMMEACQIEMSPKDDEELASEWVGQRYQAFYIVKKQPERNKDGSENQYAGNEQNEAKAYYPIGTHEARVLDDGEMPASVKRVSGPARTVAAENVPGARVVAQRATKVTATTAPVATKANGQTPPPKAAKPAAATRSMKCSMCNTDVPVAGFAQHVEESHPEE